MCGTQLAPLRTQQSTPCLTKRSLRICSVLAPTRSTVATWGSQSPVAIHGFVRGGTGLRGGSVSNPVKYDRYGTPSVHLSSKVGVVTLHSDDRAKPIVPAFLSTVVTCLAENDAVVHGALSAELDMLDVMCACALKSRRLRHYSFALWPHTYSRGSCVPSRGC